jgi:hypothetical protein
MRAMPIEIAEAMGDTLGFAVGVNEGIADQPACNETFNLCFC